MRHLYIINFLIAFAVLTTLQVKANADNNSYRIKYKNQTVQDSIKTTSPKDSEIKEVPKSKRKNRPEEVEEPEKKERPETERPEKAERPEVKRPENKGRPRDASGKPAGKGPGKN